MYSLLNLPVSSDLILKHNELSAAIHMKSSEGCFQVKCLNVNIQYL